MTAQPTSDVRVLCWTRLALMQPQRSGEYRVRNYDCQEGIAFFTHPKDGNPGWAVSFNWPGGDIADWMELDS